MWLALDTATDRASVALGVAGAVPMEENISGARRHAASLLPALQGLLRLAGASLDDLEGIALSDGPGSFTGLRVGASVAKALVHARGVPLWTAPSLMVRAAGVTAGPPAAVKRLPLSAFPITLDLSANDAMMAGQPLPPKMRLARNVHEGMDVHTVDGEWKRVVSALHITAPLQVSALTLADGTALDLPALIEVGRKHEVKFLKAMQCLNIPNPLGQGLWAGVPLRAQEKPALKL